jgi:KUP system potassium uptake protein
MAPPWALLPLVVLATLATVIASQAVISGAYSLTRQAVQLGFSPRVRIDHTSRHEIGQIYIPGLNWLMLIACIALVLSFRTSSNLAAAYGVAVTSTMAITTVLFYVVARRRWNWSLPAAAALCGLFLVIDLAFFGANIIKLLDGGWFPLTVGLVIYVYLSTWKDGRRLLGERLRAVSTPLRKFIEGVRVSPPLRVPGTAVFLYSNKTGTPPALTHNLEHNHVLHESVVILNVNTLEVPHVAPDERDAVETIGEGFYRIVVNYGFMEEPDVPAVLAKIDVPGLDLDPKRVSYFLGSETLLATNKPGMMLWREKLFILMTRNANRATQYFNIPPNRVVELGSQVEL